MASNIKNPVGNWQKPLANRPLNEPADVTVVQALLTEVSTKIGEPAIRPHVVNGTISKPPKKSSTVNAIMEFQKQFLSSPMPDGRIDPDGKTWKGLNWFKESRSLEILNSVHTDLRKKVFAFIAQFGAVTISSGKRTVMKQAELMAVMSDSDLDMYGAISAYVVQIKALPKPSRTVSAVETILNAAIQQGSKISDHLQGNAVDISAAGGFSWANAELIAKKLGLKPKQEKSRNCFHVSR